MTKPELGPRFTPTIHEAHRWPWTWMGRLPLEGLTGPGSSHHLVGDTTAFLGNCPLGPVQHGRKVGVKRGQVTRSRDREYSH